ncbi:MAG: hypothetical protein ACK583_18065 [Cyanobacteriota bacterium]|jgi:hypothetical protein
MTTARFRQGLHLCKDSFLSGFNRAQASRLLWLRSSQPSLGKGLSLRGRMILSQQVRMLFEEFGMGSELFRRRLDPRP